MHAPTCTHAPQHRDMQRYTHSHSQSLHQECVELFSLKEVHKTVRSVFSAGLRAGLYSKSMMSLSAFSSGAFAPFYLFDLVPHPLPLTLTLLVKFGFDGKFDA